MEIDELMLLWSSEFLCLYYPVKLDFQIKSTFAAFTFSDIWNLGTPFSTNLLSFSCTICWSIWWSTERQYFQVEVINTLLYGINHDTVISCFMLLSVSIIVRYLEGSAVGLWCLDIVMSVTNVAVTQLVGIVMEINGEAGHLMFSPL